jgi:hypothetical protein
MMMAGADAYTPLGEVAAVPIATPPEATLLAITSAIVSAGLASTALSATITHNHPDIC